MVEPKVLLKGFAVAAQLSAEDFPALAAAGYKTIICNRPDEEDPPHLQSSQARALAAANRLNYVYIPMTVPTLTAEVADRFGEALEHNPGPVVAHCKTGTRSCILWSMVTARDNLMTLEELMDCAARGGYDLSRVRPTVEQYIQARMAD